MDKSTINEQIIDKIFHISRAMRQQMLFNSKIRQLSLLQIETLIFLKQREAESAQMRDIANNFRITMPSATSLINTLVTFQLVVRKTTPTDRRIVRIALSKKGEKLLIEVLNAKQKRINHTLRYLSEDQKKNTLTFLETILKHVGEKANEK